MKASDCSCCTTSESKHTKIDGLQKTLMEMQKELDRFTAPGGPLDKQTKTSEKIMNDIAAEIKQKQEELDCLNEQNHRLQVLLSDNQNRMMTKCLCGRMKEARDIVGNAIVTGETEKASKKLAKLNTELTACLNSELKELAKQMNEIEKAVKKCKKK